MTLRAILYSDRDKHRADALPGAVWFSDPGDGGVVVSMWFFCPCGCGLHRITVGIGHNPHLNTATWRWDGNIENPTLHPSVHNLPCGWHGWLKAGYWERA